MHISNWGRSRAIAWRLLPLVSLLLLVAFAVSCTAANEAPQTTTAIAGTHNEELWNPYRIIMWLAGIVFVAVMALTLWVSLRFRERPGRTAQQFHGNTRLEILWTLIPVAIVAIIAVPTLNTIRTEAKAPPADAMKVVVIGHQWWFEFQYPDLGITTANELHIPVGKTVTFDIRSTDVIHSFWVPQLAGKIDMVPGRLNQISFAGTVAREEPYLGQCAELCGLSHANMRFRVYVDTQADFDAWVANEKANAVTPTESLARQGQEIFSRSACIGCHTIKGNPAAVGVIGPNLSHIGDRGTFASGVLPMTQQNLEKWIKNSADIKPGSKMPPMGASAGGTLTDEEVRAVAAYMLALK